jgi:tetratricopeptide (TPR) repeat protein
MAFFDKLFGGKTLEQERKQADALFAEGEFGRAKLAYERALGLTRDVKDAPDIASELNARIALCRDNIAKAHLAEAERLLAQGSVELARDELLAVGETASDPALLRTAQERLDQLERAVARAEQQEHHDPSEDDRFELIAGSFEDDQYAEYQAHGDRVREALLQLHDGRSAEARRALEEIVSGADAPRFLWFELGRARLADGDSQAGTAALETFLSKLHEAEGGDARLSAHIELAQLIHARGDFDAAVAHYEAALAALPDDPRPYLAMANFFRREQLFDEAAEVLEAGLQALEGHGTDFRLWLELGLTHADAGRDADATRWLERVVAFFSSRRQTDLPPEGAVALARLYEKQPDGAGRALDLYSVLAQGSDRPNLFLYHLEAARLMKQLELPVEARRMLQRARELAPPDEAIQARINQALSELESPPSA